MIKVIKSKPYYIPLLLLVFACWSTNSRAQAVQAIAKIDQSPIRIGDQTRLHLSVMQELKQAVVFPKLGDTLTGKIQVLGSSKPDTIPDANDRNRITVTQSITITSFDEGSYVVPALVFGTPAGPVKSNEVVLTVQSVKVDTTKSIYDIKQPLAVTYTWLDWLRDNWVWVVLPLLVIVIVGFGLYYWRKKQQRKPVIAVAKPLVPVHTLALDKLNALRDKKLWQQNEVKLYYSELSEVIREYLEKRYRIKTQETTTEEIFDGLRRKEITEENKALLRQLLVLSDLVKFAKEQPLAQENEQSIVDAIAFVMDTKEIVQPPVQPAAGKEGGVGRG